MLSFICNKSKYFSASATNYFRNICLKIVLVVASSRFAVKIVFWLVRKRVWANGNPIETKCMIKTYSMYVYNIKSGPCLYCHTRLKMIRCREIYMQSNCVLPFMHKFAEMIIIFSVHVLTAVIRRTTGNIAYIRLLLAFHSFKHDKTELTHDYEWLTSMIPCAW